MDHDAIEMTTSDDTVTEPAAAGDDQTVDELLIEEISIDGMCGVY